MNARRRHLLGALALGLLLTLSGCAGALGSGTIPDQQLDAEPPLGEYQWNTGVDAHIRITDDAQFQAVYNVSEEQINLYRRDGFGGKEALELSAVRYRFDNGTVINGSEFARYGGRIRLTRQAVEITVPGSVSESNPGQLAFTAPSTPKRFALPTLVDGSYEIVLPPGRRVDFFLFGNVHPPGYEKFTDGRDRVHLVWPEGINSDVVIVQFYLQRDLLIFGALAAVLGLVAVGGGMYYRRQIQSLQEEREELGLDVDTGDDEFRRGPPPGMR
jgi:hypothetical protein